MSLSTYENAEGTQVPPAGPPSYDVTQRAIAFGGTHTLRRSLAYGATSENAEGTQVPPAGPRS